MIPGSNEQLQQKLEYTLLKSDCHSWWISKMQSGRQDTLEPLRHGPCWTIQNEFMGIINLMFLLYLESLLLCMIFYLCSYSDFF